MLARRKVAGLRNPDGPYVLYHYGIQKTIPIKAFRGPFNSIIVVSMDPLGNKISHRYSEAGSSSWLGDPLPKAQTPTKIPKKSQDTVGPQLYVNSFGAKVCIRSEYLEPRQNANARRMRQITHGPNMVMHMSVLFGGETHPFDKNN